MEAAQVLDTYLPVAPTLAQQAVLNTARVLREEGGSGIGTSRRGGSSAAAVAAAAGGGGLGRVKVVLLGDPWASRAQILASYARATPKLRQTAAPDGDERGLQLEGDLLLDGRTLTVEIVDAPLADVPRAAAVPLTTLFLIFFSVVDPDSYANALKKVRMCVCACACAWCLLVVHTNSLPYSISLSLYIYISRILYVILARIR
jgi:hypothetical protein